MMMMMMTMVMTTMMVMMMMVDDDDDDGDDDDDAVAAPRAGQAFAGRCVSACHQLRAAWRRALPMPLCEGRHLEEPLREHLRGHLQLQAALSREGRGPFQLLR